MMEALEKVYQYWVDDCNIDPFTEGVSLSGLSFESMVRSLDPFSILPLIPPQHQDLEEFFRNALVGGPSIIFHQEAHAGVTRVPDGELVQAIHGYDVSYNYFQLYLPLANLSLFLFLVNSLYPSCLRLPLPVNVGLRYRPVAAPPQEAQNDDEAPVEDVQGRLIFSN